MLSDDVDEYPVATELELRVMAEFVHRPLANVMLGVDEGLPIGRLSDAIVRATLAAQVGDIRLAGIAREVAGLKGRVVVVRGAFYFKRVERQRDERFHFHSKLKVDSGLTIALDGEFDPGRFEANSPRTNLSGQRHVYIVGVATEVDLSLPRVSIRPILIGSPYFAQPGTYPDPMFARSRPEVFAYDIDQFGLTERDMKRPATDAELARLFSMPEQQVKKSFGHILGLTTLPKDWGGEHSDLVAEVSLRGVRGRAAFALKGPGGKAKPWMLHPKNMGTNGDQAMRLFLETADLFVVQHCHSVSEQVRHLMDALATKHRKRYMILDGDHTVRILRTAILLPRV